MTLENLLTINKLSTLAPDKGSIARLMIAANRNLADAQLVDLSTDNRFDAAYKTIMQCAMIGLAANGYRTSQSQPGHHQVAIQCLPKSMGLGIDKVIVLDALRKKRNLSDWNKDCGE